MERAERVTRRWFHFDNHWSVAHCSDPNFSTLLGGQPPWVTNITTQMGAEFKAVSAVLLPLVLKKNGYFTCAIEPVKVPRFYHAFEDIAWQPTEASADLELGAVTRLMDAAGDRPLFMFIRDMTCHYPYHEQPSPPRGEGGDIIPLYESAVDHIDQHLEAITAYVLERQPNTVFIVCADHGELLGEHNQWDHLWTLFNYLVRVPMAVYIPGRSGKRTGAMTQHTDIWPTILNLCGVSVKSEYGVSWHKWLTKNKRLPKDRTLWFQGIGAGPVLTGDDRPRIDPGVGRMLYRHRAAVNKHHKLIEDIHADGWRKQYLYPAGDYTEAKPLKRKKTKLTLPPVPQYHDWEIETLQKRKQAQDQIILERLKELGYA